MSTAVSHDPEQDRSRLDETATAVAPVVVRRNAGVAALVGAAASAAAIAYLWRATQSGAPLDWALCVVMAVIGTLHLVNLVDARTPLLVADDLGVRVRLGNQWRGLPWDAVDAVVVQPSRGVFKDGRLSFAPHSSARALDGLDARGRRAAALNQRVYGAALAVPMGLTTRVSAHGSALIEGLTLLADGRADVVVPHREVVAETSAGPTASEHVEAPVRAPDDVRDGPDVVVQPARPAARSTVPLRDTRHATRAQVTRDTPAQAPGDGARSSARGAPRAPDATQPGDGRVRPIARLGEPVDALVVDDFVTEPAYDPVIGPELAAARTRVGLSVDELSERTRIRPHVIEAIEVDDFAPCGGDFYARGHLRTLARVLGRDPVPLLAQFDDRYASAPVNARRVFEAELATGMTGSMRSTVRGPNWPLLVGVVLALALTWGVVRLFASEPAEVLQNPAVNGSAGLAQPRAPRVATPPRATPRPMRLTLLGAQNGSQVVVHDGAGRVVWAGAIMAGEERTVRATPPVRVRAEDAGSVEVSVDGEDQGVIGLLGESGRRTFVRPGVR